MNKSAESRTRQFEEASAGFSAVILTVIPVISTPSTSLRAGSRRNLTVKRIKDVPFFPRRNLTVKRIKDVPFFLRTSPFSLFPRGESVEEGKLNV